MFTRNKEKPSDNPARTSGTLRVTVEEPSNDRARACIEAFFQELSARFPQGFTPDLSIPANDADLVLPHGALILAWIDGQAAGCGALTGLQTSHASIKRMWTAPWARRQGVATAVLRHLEGLAREAGHAVLRLETNRWLVEARAFYRSKGFDEVAAFSVDPYADHWFAKTLD